MMHKIQCECGSLLGHIDGKGITSRVICYCTDCQALLLSQGPEPLQGTVPEAHMQHIEVDLCHWGGQMFIHLCAAVFSDVSSNQTAVHVVYGLGLPRILCRLR